MITGWAPWTLPPPSSGTSVRKGLIETLEAEGGGQRGRVAPTAAALIPRGVQNGCKRMRLSNHQKGRSETHFRSVSLTYSLQRFQASRPSSVLWTSFS